MKKKLKVALHLLHWNSFSTKKSWHIFKFDHRWRTTLIQKKLVRLAKNGVSQKYIGPLIIEKIQMYILTKAELLYTLCYEIPCSRHFRCANLVKLVKSACFWGPRLKGIITTVMRTAFLVLRELVLIQNKSHDH